MLYGNWVAGQPIQPATYCSAAFVIVYIMLINGVHGSIRDLPTDAAYGVRSTALGFGATFAPPDRIALSWSLRLYAAFLQLLLIGLSYWLLLAESSPNALVGWASLSLLACGAFLYLLTQAQMTKLAAVGTLQAICAYWCMSVALFQPIGAIGLACLLGVYFAPMLLSDWLLPSFSGKLDLKTVPITNKQ